MVLKMAMLAVILLGASALQPVNHATGYVFEDLNKNGVRDSGERGIPGVRVSDQVQIVTTNRQGKWSMPLTGDDLTFFVIKPRGWMTRVDENQLPQFFYSHKPNGSPAQKFAGVSPTGPLPASINFPLYKTSEPNTFEALFFGDTQTRDAKEVEYLRKDVIEPFIGRTNASFGVTLGDIVFDDLDVLDPLVRSIALLGMPWYNVIGNHDINFDAADDEDSDETFERWFGPNYYSFDHGPVHFIVMDNVHWSIADGAERGTYIGKFGEKQLAWVTENLKSVPRNRLIVLCMHIPLVTTRDREDLYRIIENRPYTLSVAAHTHFQEHHFIGKDKGWNGANPHHHLVNVTTCGSWWQGSLDHMGIPHTQMRDGAPNGFSIFKFDGNQYSIEFRAARREVSYQIQINAPDEIPYTLLQRVTVYANVFGGNEKSKVEYRVGNDPVWREMTKTLEPDPSYVAMFESDKGLQRPLRPLPAPISSPHLWMTTIRGNLPAGLTPVHVRTTDMFGQSYLATKGILVK